MCNRVYPFRIRRQGLCRAKLPRKHKIFALSTYAGRKRGGFWLSSHGFRGVRKWKTPTHICDMHASCLLWSGEHSNFERLTREHQLKGITEACQGEGGGDQCCSRQMPRGQHLERQAHVIRRIVEHSPERELVIMQRLRIQTH